MVYDYFYWVNRYINNLNDFSEEINGKKMDSFEEERIEQNTIGHQP